MSDPKQPDQDQRPEGLPEGLAQAAAKIGKMQEDLQTLTENITEAADVLQQQIEEVHTSLQNYAELLTSKTEPMTITTGNIKDQQAVASSVEETIEKDVDTASKARTPSPPLPLPITSSSEEEPTTSEPSPGELELLQQVQALQEQAHNASQQLHAILDEAGIHTGKSTDPLQESLPFGQDSVDPQADQEEAKNNNDSNQASQWYGLGGLEDDEYHDPDRPTPKNPGEFTNFVPDLPRQEPTQHYAAERPFATREGEPATLPYSFKHQPGQGTNEEETDEEKAARERDEKYKALFDDLDETFHTIEKPKPKGFWRGFFAGGGAALATINMIGRQAITWLTGGAGSILSFMFGTAASYYSVRYQDRKYLKKQFRDALGVEGTWDAFKKAKGLRARRGALTAAFNRTDGEKLLFAQARRDAKAIMGNEAGKAKYKKTFRRAAMGSAAGVFLVYGGNELVESGLLGSWFDKAKDMINNLCGSPVSSPTIADCDSSGKEWSSTQERLKILAEKVDSGEIPPEQGDKIAQVINDDYLNREACAENAPDGNIHFQTLEDVHGPNGDPDGIAPGGTFDKEAPLIEENTGQEMPVREEISKSTMSSWEEQSSQRIKDKAFAMLNGFGGVEKDLDQAVRLYQQAAAAGNQQAITDLAYLDSIENAREFFENAPRLDSEVMVAELPDQDIAEEFVLDGSGGEEITSTDFVDAALGGQLAAVEGGVDLHLNEEQKTVIAALSPQTTDVPLDPPKQNIIPCTLGAEIETPGNTLVTSFALPSCDGVALDDIVEKGTIFKMAGTHGQQEFFVAEQPITVGKMTALAQGIDESNHAKYLAQLEQEKLELIASLRQEEHALKVAEILQQNPPPYKIAI